VWTLCKGARSVIHILIVISYAEGLMSVVKFLVGSFWLVHAITQYHDCALHQENLFSRFWTNCTSNTSAPGAVRDHTAYIPQTHPHFQITLGVLRSQNNTSFRQSQR
jgi:hypothetical protein